MISNIYHKLVNLYIAFQRRKMLHSLYSQYSKGLILKTLTKEQKNEIHKYWYELTGRVVSLKSHKLLYSITGEYRKEFMPFEICFSIQDYLSPHKERRYFDDKNLYRFLLKDFNISKRYVECSSGSWSLIVEGHAIESNQKECASFLQSIGYCVIKPSIGTDGGNGVRLLHLCNGIDDIKGESIDEILKEYSPNLLVEDRIVECENLSRLNPDSCNTIRVHTWRNREDNRIYFISAYLRIGKKGTIKDNMYSGGVGAKVNLDGTISNAVSCYPEYKVYNKTDSGISLSGYKIVNFELIKETAIKAHASLTMFDLIGWDIGVNTSNEVVIIEFNPNPDVRIEQCIFGDCCYQEQTESICRRIFKK